MAQGPFGNYADEDPRACRGGTRRSCAPGRFGFSGRTLRRYWIAAGDACCGHDPLSKQGIARSLYSGIIAAYAIVDTLCETSPLGMRRYRHLIRHGWSGYLSARSRFYAEERRWPESLFWQRRQ
jgi:flavin-dependent dehydrogenase